MNDTNNWKSRKLYVFLFVMLTVSLIFISVVVTKEELSDKKFDSYLLFMFGMSIGYGLINVSSKLINGLSIILYAWRGIKIDNKPNGN